jgi:solute carrier family 35 protein C2
MSCHRLEWNKAEQVGIALYTYHKYQKSIATPTPLSNDAHTYTSLHPSSASGVPLEHLDSPSPTYPPPPPPRETTEDRTQRLRDEFEGWGRESSTWSESDREELELELGEDEVERRMTERDGSKGVTTGSSKGGWGEWWMKSM